MIALYSISALTSGRTHVAFGFLTGSESRFIDQRIKTFTDFLRRVVRKAGSRFTGVKPFIAFVSAQIEGSDPPRFGTELFNERDDWERVALIAFEFNPGLYPA